MVSVPRPVWQCFLHKKTSFMAWVGKFAITPFPRVLVFLLDEKAGSIFIPPHN
ncbi:hypothetical protein M434DRAFT_289185 [Hypoxylon sp. CO27-5]|nr:hypothetical protein M434DRAFT_289185 [Hypoxylon sp. CO27-5]